MSRYLDNHLNWSGRITQMRISRLSPVTNHVAFLFREREPYEFTA